MGNMCSCDPDSVKQEEVQIETVYALDFTSIVEQEARGVQLAAG